MRPALGVRCASQPCRSYATKFISVDSTEVPVCRRHWLHASKVIQQITRAQADRRFEQSAGQEIGRRLEDVICSYFECPERATKNLTVTEPLDDMDGVETYEVPYCDVHYEEYR